MIWSPRNAETRGCFAISCSNDDRHYIISTIGVTLLKCILICLPFPLKVTTQVETARTMLRDIFIVMGC